MIRFLIAVVALLALMSCAAHEVEDIALQMGAKHHSRPKQ